MKRRRLNLNRETLRTLDTLQMRHAAGGASVGDAQGTGCFIDNNDGPGGTGGGSGGTNPTDAAGCTVSAAGCGTHPPRSGMCFPTEHLC